MFSLSFLPPQVQSTSGRIVSFSISCGHASAFCPIPSKCLHFVGGSSVLNPSTTLINSNVSALSALPGVVSRGRFHSLVRSLNSTKSVTPLFSLSLVTTEFQSKRTFFLSNGIAASKKPIVSRKSNSSSKESPKEKKSAKDKKIKTIRNEKQKGKSSREKEKAARAKEKERTARAKEIERNKQKLEREKLQKEQQKQKEKEQKEREREKMKEKRLALKEKQREKSQKEQEKLRQQKEKERMRKMKEKQEALKLKKMEKEKNKLHNRPKRPPSAFSFFMSEMFPKLREKNQGTPIPDIMRLCSKQWKEMPESDRKSFASKAEVARSSYMEKLNEYKSNLGPKRPLSAYLLFMQNFRSQILKKQPELKVSEVGKLAGQQWRKLSEAEKKPYMLQAAKALETYKKTKEDSIKKEDTGSVAE